MSQYSQFDVQHHESKLEVVALDPSGEFQLHTGVVGQASAPAPGRAHIGTVAWANCGMVPHARPHVHGRIYANGERGHVQVGPFYLDFPLRTPGAVATKGVLKVCKDQAPIQVSLHIRATTEHLLVATTHHDFPVDGEIEGCGRMVPWGRLSDPKALPPGKVRLTFKNGVLVDSQLTGHFPNTHGKEEYDPRRV